MDSSLISVVIPTYNRGDLIKRTIDSVLSQTYSNFELIIVDDASTDQTKAIIENYKDNRIRYYRLKENSQGTKPRNFGIQKSRGEYIALLDSDDEWLPCKLEKQLAYIKQYEGNNLICYSDLIIQSEEGKYTSNNKFFSKDEDIIDYMFIDNVNTWVQASTYMFSSEIGKKTLFNSRLKKHQDIDFCLRLRKNGAKFIQLQEALTIYHHEKRDDRVGNNNKYNRSLEWINEVKNDISTKAYHSFYIMFVVHRLILDNKRLKALVIYKNAYKEGVINKSVLINGVIKCFIPSKLMLFIMSKRGKTFI